MPVIVRANTNKLDTNNSTTTPLGIGGIFTGTGTDVLQYATVTVTLATNVDSATDAMTFQFSTDNTNWDDVNEFNLETSLSNVRRFQFPVTAQYFRVVYTNGGTGQTYLRIATILHSTNTLTSIHRVDQGLTNDRSVAVVKAVISGQNKAGSPDFVNVKVNPSGALVVDAENTPYGLQVARGDIGGALTLRKFGKNPDIDTGTVPESLWNGGGLYTGFSTAAQRIRVAAGGNAADDIAGTGAQKVTFYGLDGTGAEISEEVDTAGASASGWTTLTFKRMWRAKVTQVGSGGYNAAEIVVEQETSGDIMASMPAGKNQTHICCWTVPAGKTFYIVAVYISTTAGTGTNTEFDLFVDEGQNGIFYSKQPTAIVEQGGNYTFLYNYEAIEENSDLDVRCVATTSNNIVASASFLGIILDN